jgi:hypothetical protein
MWSLETRSVAAAPTTPLEKSDYGFYGLLDERMGDVEGDTVSDTFATRRRAAAEVTVG